MLVFAFLVFVFPIALYCGILAAINRRLHPLLIPGIWDTVGLLFACSGILLVAGPTILANFYRPEGVRELLIQDSGQPAPTWMIEVFNHWGLLWIAYYGGVIVLGALLLWMRKSTTTIYNITYSQLTQVLHRALDTCAPGSKQTGNRIFLGTQPFLKIDYFPAFHHATLQWETNFEQQRQEQIETYLRQALAQIHSEDNPSSQWLFGISSALFGMMFLTILTMLVFLVIRSNI